MDDLIANTRRHLPVTSKPLASKIKVSYCTTCHGRLWQLALTLHSNIGRLEDDEEIVLVDYGSPDGLKRFVESSEICQQAIKNKKLVYAYTPAGHYHCPRAKNLAHRIARGDYLVNLDADNSNKGIRDQINKCFESDKRRVLHLDDNNHNGSFGRICLHRDWFYKLGGYDESLLPIAYQDSDLIKRAEAIGLEYVLSVSSSDIPVHNSLQEKSIHTGYNNWWNIKEANKETSERNLLEGRFTANLQGWGAAVASINFGRPKMLPPISQHKISLAILNWGRPQNVQQLVGLYNQMQIFGEIFVINNRPETLVQINSPKVVMINASRDLGLFSRFAVASLASYPTVLLVDDDLFLPENTIKQLYSAWCADPMILHGLVGRNTVSGQYSYKSVTGPCEIVLTRAVMTTPATCARALTFAPDFCSDLSGYAKGNGEDILMSMLTMEATNRLNIAHSFHFEEWPTSGGIHKRKKSHFYYRTEVVKWCRDHMILNEPSTLPINH